MNPQFKFEKQSINENAVFNTNPEQVVMLSLQNDMKRFKFRSFKSYLKDLETKRIQRTSISIREISSLLNVSNHCAEQLATKGK